MHFYIPFYNHNVSKMIGVGIIGSVNDGSNVNTVINWPSQNTVFRTDASQPTLLQLQKNDPFCVSNRNIQNKSK